MGKRRVERPGKLWIATTDIARGPGCAFYRGLNRVLDEAGFDDHTQDVCREFYASGRGRPSMPPESYFRLLMVGYFEGIPSERGIAWQLGDSLSLKEFVGLGPTDRGWDHSTLSKARKRISIEAHEEVFTWVLRRLRESKLLRGRKLGVDGTTLRANAALRAIRRRDSGEAYREFLRRLARESGIETPTLADLKRVDRKRRRKKKTGWNREWTQPVDPDARIGKMKSGETRMLHKVEHAVDLETGAMAAVVVQPGDQGDTKTLETTVEEMEARLEDAEVERGKVRVVVCDKGYHSDETMVGLKRKGLRSYVAEPQRGRRKWAGKEEEKKAVYLNRRRIRRSCAKGWLARRGEVVERSFAHCYETGGLRRLYLRGRENIGKRLQIHAAAFNLGLLMRTRYGVGTPRTLQRYRRLARMSHSERLRRLQSRFRALWRLRGVLGTRFRLGQLPASSHFVPSQVPYQHLHSWPKGLLSTA